MTLGIQSFNDATDNLFNDNCNRQTKALTLKKTESQIRLIFEFELFKKFER